MSMVTWIRNTSTPPGTGQRGVRWSERMTQEELWEGFETGRGPFFQAPAARSHRFRRRRPVFFGSLALSWPQQAVLGLLMVLLCVWLSRVSDSYLITLILMMLPCLPPSATAGGASAASSPSSRIPAPNGSRRRLLHRSAPRRGSLRLRHPSTSAPPDRLAPAPRARRPARRSRRLARSDLLIPPTTSPRRRALHRPRLAQH